MSYATIDDVMNRCRRTLSNQEVLTCESLLEDAAVIIDAYNAKAASDAKRLVSCNMVIRVLGDGETCQIPIGASQGSMSALGYAQSWTMTGGSSGELYLSKIDKKLIGSGNRMTFASPYDDVTTGD